MGGGARSGYRRQPLDCPKVRRPGIREPWDGATSIVDSEQRVVWSDDATRRLLGATAAAAGRHLSDWLDPEELRVELLAMEGLDAAHPEYELEQRWPGFSGGGATVLVRGTRLAPLAPGCDTSHLPALFVRQVLVLATDGAPEPDGGAAQGTEGGTAKGSVVDARGDPTWVALAEAELRAEQLESANRDLSEFAYIAAHDLRAPLAALAGSAELLARRGGPELSEESQRYLAAVLAKVGTMGRMIDDILAFCHAGRDHQARQIVDCNDVIGEVLEHLAPDIFEARASVSLAAMGKVAGERTQLVQLFQNVIANALKFRRPTCRARVEISLQRVGDEHVYSVADDGIGVPPVHRGDVFRMFHQLQRSTNPQGTGIGLAICKRVVERHGGRIWVDDGIDGGLRVSFTLPAVDD